MTSHLEVENISDDNGMSLFRSQRIKVHGKVGITPFRALDPSKFRSKFPLHENSFGVNEVYKLLNPKKIQLLEADSVQLDRFSRELKNTFSKSQQTDLNFCMIRYDSDSSKPFPNTREIEFMADVLETYSDLIPISMLEMRIVESNFLSYMSYLEKSCRTIDELSVKPIMGILPNLSREQYPILLKFYIDKGIRAFYFDFNGRTPDHLVLRPILRYLKKERVLDQTLIYGINARSGRLLRNIPVAPSKDFIAFGLGLDVLGGSHLRRIFPKSFFEKMKKAIDHQQHNKKRIFMKSDYGYYQTDVSLDSIYPTDTKIPLSSIFEESGNTWQNLFNMEQQGIEAAEIRKRLKDLDPNATVLEYIKEKANVVGEIKRLKLSMKNVAKV